MCGVASRAAAAAVLRPAGDNDPPAAHRRDFDLNLPKAACAVRSADATLLLHLVSAARDSVPESRQHSRSRASGTPQVAFPSRESK